jgi:membrane protein YqaA with SNARE-associated domain
VDPVSETSWLILGTFAYCVGSGIVPVLNAEAYLLVVSAASSRVVVGPLILAATLGQMTAKCLIYLSGRGILRIPFRKHREKLDAAHRRLSASRVGTGGFLFLSASLGLPPFYVVSILAGTVQIPFPIFLLTGTAGRLVRFAAVVLVPQLVGGKLG